MIKRAMALDGVEAICAFRDDGALVEAYGVLSDDQLRSLARFAHDYKRIVQANADQLSMFTGMRGWTPPGGWTVRGPDYTVCSVGHLVCLLKHAEGSLSEVMVELAEPALVGDLCPGR